MGILSGISDFFGLDVGTSAVRVVQLSGGTPNRTIFRYGRNVIDSRLISRSDDASLVKLSEVIRDTLVQHQITTRNVVVGLPTRRMFITVNQFEDLPGDDLRKSLRFRVRNLVPGSPDRAQIDFAMLDADVYKNNQQQRRQQKAQNNQQAQESQQESQSVDVLVCAVEKSLVERQLEMLESINLNVLAFEPDALALTRAVASNDSTINILVDIGFRTTDIVVVARNQPRLVLTMEFGSSHVIRQVVNTLAVPEANALDMIFKTGVKGDESQRQLTSAIISSFDLVLTNLHKAIDFIANRYSQYQLGKVAIWGDVIFIPGLFDFLSSTLNVQVVAADSWQNINCPASVRDNLQSLGATFGLSPA